MEQPKRPVTDLNWQDIKARIREVVFFLPQYLKNPVDGIKRVPSWDWTTVIILEVLISAACGLLGGIVARHILSVLGGIIVGPVMGLIMSVVLSGILYYAGLFILKTELEYKKIFIVVVLAQIPAQIIGVLSPISRAVTPFAILISALLITVGLVDNFMLEKKRVTKIVGTLTGIVLIFWIYSAVLDITRHRIKVQEYTPESLDQIHKELSEGK
ncbi:MAG: YIP1 family protein [Oligoflexia bacterium]|nr:YIP1 family protein [Oligoflexia bacterium]